MIKINKGLNKKELMYVNPDMQILLKVRLYLIALWVFALGICMAILLLNNSWITLFSVKSEINGNKASFTSKSEASVSLLNQKEDFAYLSTSKKFFLTRIHSSQKGVAQNSAKPLNVIIFGKKKIYNKPSSNNFEIKTLPK